MREKLEHRSSLGKSDHSILTFNFNCYTVRQKLRRRSFYDKGDYKSMKEVLTHDWMQDIQGKTSVEQQWNHFLENLRAAELEFVPSKMVDSHKKRRRRYARQMDKETLEATRKKQHCWQRYLKTRGEGKYREYTRKRNKVRAMSGKIQREAEKDISTVEMQRTARSFGVLSDQNSR